MEFKPKQNLSRNHRFVLILTFLLQISVSLATENSANVYIRVNQVGYLPGEMKQAIAFGSDQQTGLQFEVIDAVTGKKVWGPSAIEGNRGSYGNFGYHYDLNFSAFTVSGRYKLKISGTENESLPFNIGHQTYSGLQNELLGFIRQQRCGYNPFLDEVCHAKDGRTAFGPMPDGTYMDAGGGWHDAADQLRYMLTSGNTICRLLIAYRDNKTVFGDEYNALGQTGANGIPDILDEAKWGLDWLHKMHPAPDQLFHQVADDRDHSSSGLPHVENADYGWGPGSYRVVYYATGKPQGLLNHINTSTGIANLAGRYAAAMAMAYDIWKNDLNDSAYALNCLKVAREVYDMGKKQPGCQEGSSYKQPYRYYESTWADDMEWGAAELYKATGEKAYLEEALDFAGLIQATSWMGQDTARHYDFYPFMNMGHYALYEHVGKEMQQKLADYYRIGLESVLNKGSENPYTIGIPFIWCSNNLAAALVNQCLVYERMTGDTKYHPLMLATRDWLLGRNPWGTSMFLWLPEGGEYPEYPHSVIASLTGRPTPGGLIDGPVYGSIFSSLRGVHLTKEDPFARFQSEYVVYHDDYADYSTNEPTLDGTAEALLFWSYFCR